jgi:hypothetical protein
MLNLPDHVRDQLPHGAFADIAKLADVSTATVGRTINGKYKRGGGRMAERVIKATHRYLNQRRELLTGEAVAA